MKKKRIKMYIKKKEGKIDQNNRRRRK